MEDYADQPEDPRRMSKGELAQRLEALQRTFPKKQDNKKARDTELQAVLHELEVYQIELEMQVRELKQSRQALEESHDRYANLYDFAPVGYVTLTELGLIKEINLTACGLIGVERHWLIERSLAPWILPAELSRFRHHLKQCRTGDGKVSTTLQLRRRDKTIVPVELSTIGFTDLNSGAVLYRTAITDLTERKKAEEDLDKFFHLSSDLLCISGKGGTFQRINSAWENALGYSTKETLARPFLDFVHPDDREATAAQLQRLAESGVKSSSFLNRILRRDRSTIWLSWTCVSSSDSIFCVARDVTAEVNAKEDAQNQFTWLQEMVKAAPIPLHLIDTATGTILSESAASDALFHVVPKAQEDEANSESYFVDSAGRRLRKKHWPHLRAMRGEELSSEEYAWHSPRGLIHLLVSSRNIPEKYGQPAVTVLVTQDISAVKKSEMQLAAAIEVSKIGFFELDLLSERNTLSQQFQEDWALSPEATPKEAESRIHPADRERVLALGEVSLRELTPFRAEYRLLRPDDSVIWIEARGKVNCDPQGKPICFSGTSLNVTERKNGELKLAFERYKLGVIFRESPAAMALYRGPGFVAEMLNSEFQGLFEERELLGLPFLEGLPELKDQQFPALLEKVFRTGDTFIGHEVLTKLARRAGGPLEDRYFDFSLVRLKDWLRKPYGVFCHAIEVTDRVHARRALEDSKSLVQNTVTKLEVERDLRERFVAALTHDLRTPLAAAKLGAELLLRKEPTIAHLSTVAARISRNLSRAEQMILDLLDAGRIKAGEPLPLSLEKCVLNSLARKTIANLEEIHGTRFVIEAPDRILGYWDKNALTRMIENLAGNAIKYGSKTAAIVVGLVQMEKTAEISVRNFGKVVPEEELEALFKPFHRTEEAVKSGQKGWGIGLTLVQGFAEAHGGKVSVTSTRDSGTTFTVRLPLDSRATPT